MRRTLALLPLLAALLFAHPAAAAPAALHIGSHGQRVRDLQWLLSGQRPSVYKLRTYAGPVDGQFGPMTRDAVRGMKWRLGYPKTAVNGRAGKQLFEFLLGRRQRPLEWIGRASKRVHAAIAHTSACANRIIRTAESQLGVHEIPDGSNDGARVRVFQRVTGAFRAPWCASFVQWLLKTSGYGTIADRSAGVFYIVSWAHKRAWLHALPKPGAAVAYLRNLGHIGIVERVTRTGFYAIEGNEGNAVRRVWHPTGDHLTVFIWMPGCITGTPTLTPSFRH